MEKKRTQIIAEVFKDIHGNLVPMFRWINYPHMEYYYNEETDTIDCDCGVWVVVSLKDEEISYDTILQLLYDLEDKVREKYLKEQNIYLYYDD